MPNLNAFDKLDESLKQKILGGDYNRRIFVEMLSDYGLYRYSKYTLSMTSFGDSAPSKDLLTHFGFTPTNLANKIKECIKEN